MKNRRVFKPSEPIGEPAAFQTGFPHRFNFVNLSHTTTRVCLKSRQFIKPSELFLILATPASKKLGSSFFDGIVEIRFNGDMHKTGVQNVMIPANNVIKPEVNLICIKNLSMVAIALFERA